MLEGGECATIREIAAAEKINESYVGRVLRLTLLAPDFVEAILDGRQPAQVTLAVLMRPFAVGWGSSGQRWCVLPPEETIGWPTSIVGQNKPLYTASLAALTGRALMILRAGLALNTVGSLVKGLMPLRAFVAGFLMTTNFAKPGTKNAPVFFSSL
jgi:hypothetical protein